MEKILSECALFDGIGREELSAMLGCLGTRQITVKKGQTVFSEGEPTGFIGIVLTGAVQLVRQDYYGNRSIVTSVGAGELFGESYAFSGAQLLPVSVVAQQDSTIALFDSRRVTTSCCNACAFHQKLIYNLLHLVSVKNLMLHRKIHITSRRSTREKLMAYLLMQAKEAGKSSFTIPYDRQQLADYLEVDRSGLSAEISKLRKEGILECEKSTFRLLD